VILVPDSSMLGLAFAILNVCNAIVLLISEKQILTMSFTVMDRIISQSRTQFDLRRQRECCLGYAPTDPKMIVAQN
jgi:hypothetical protein